jgi:glycosyltransferase involved in cell wall biosynthesis
VNAILLEAPIERRPRLRLLALSSDTFPPWRVDVSVLFGEELARRGHRIDWLLQSEAECAHHRDAPWGGGHVWIAAADRGTTRLRRLRNHLLDIRNDLRLFRLMGSGRYEAIEVKDKFLAGLFALLAARLYRRRFIYWLSFPLAEFYLARAREGTARYPLLYRLRGLACGFLLYRVLLPAADHVFVQSEQMRRDVAERGIAPGKLSVVPMGISRAAVGAPRDGATRRRIPEGERCFLYLGALGRERRIDFLLRVLARVRREVPDAKLYLVGHAACAEDEHFLVEEARRLQLLESVVFVGALPRAAALEYVQEADVCVSPLPPDPMLNCASPTKLVEYMAIGKPVIANHHPEQQFLIGESGCGYCVPYEEEAFAEGIAALLRSPELARSLGERGRRYILEHRTYDRIADAVEDQLLRVAGPRETRARASA